MTRLITIDAMTGEVLDDSPALTPGELERLIDHRLSLRLAVDPRYVNAEHSAAQGDAEEEILSEIESEVEDAYKVIGAA